MYKIFVITATICVEKMIKCIRGYKKHHINNGFNDQIEPIIVFIVTHSSSLS